MPIEGALLASGDLNPNLTPGEVGGTGSTGSITPMQNRLYLLAVHLTAGLDAGSNATVTGWGLTWEHVIRSLGTSAGTGVDVFATAGFVIPGAVSWSYDDADPNAAAIWALTEWKDVKGKVDGIRQAIYSTDSLMEIWLEALESPQSMAVGFLASGNNADVSVLGDGYSSLVIHNGSDFTGSLSIQYLEGGGVIVPGSTPSQTPAYVGPGGANVDWTTIAPASRAMVALELTEGGEAPWLRQRQRDDVTRSRRFGNNAPRSEQRGTRTSTNNRYQ